MEYYSHYRKLDDAYQQNRDHQQNVAILCEEKCGIPLLKRTAYLVGLAHDGGKMTEEWQVYFLQKCKERHSFQSKKLDHSTMGGLIAASYEPESIFADMVRIAIFMHHGVSDCISLEDGKSLAAKRSEKYSSKEIEQIRNICEVEAAKSGVDLGKKNDLQRLSEQARQEIQKLIERLKQIPGEKKKYGSIHFYLGMCERMLLSLLGDADIIDTVSFENNESAIGLSDHEIERIWKEANEHLECKLQEMKENPKADSPINRIRTAISERCKAEAYGQERRYRLAVPTGAGKTLSSLRFALTKAVEEKKRHIFYVAPFRSILEQNSADIIEAVGNREWVLEHHGDVISEDEEQNQRYEHLIENWDDVPIIATTAVQFFNTLFKEKKRNLRRFHALCNSVIILDEVQSFPVKVMALFNLSVNFLTEICNSTVVLCTATQPLTENIETNKMMKTTLMTEPLSVYEPYFRRVNYEDCSNGGKNPWTAEETAAFIDDKAETEKQVLAIFNTKAAAKRVYDLVRMRGEGKIYHLSTSMCAEHRKDVLKKIKEDLRREAPVICISTQIVEAGWDVSFQCVIRSMAGLDNLIQAAGRCNRNGTRQMGNVYLIQMRESEEKIVPLPEIRKAQRAMCEVLRLYGKNPDYFNGRIDSEKMIENYYIKYLQNQTDSCFPVKVKDIQTDLVELLSSAGSWEKKKERGVYLKQAFKTAGEVFTLIEEKPGIDVVVSYGKAKELLEALDKTTDFTSKRRLVRRLQSYIVNVSEYMLKKMGRTAVFQREDGILVLDERFYNQETGVRREPGEMNLLFL